MGCLGRERGVHCGNQKASAVMGVGRAGGGGGSPFSMLLMVGELTLGYHSVEGWSSSRGNGRRGSEGGHCRQPSAGCFLL